MQRLAKHLQDESGAILITVVVVLIALTALGITIMNIGGFEIDIAVNDQCHKVAFYNADSIAWSAPKLIRTITDESQPIVAGSNDALGIQYLNTTTGSPENEFYERVNGYVTYDAGKDLSFQPAGIDADLDVRPLGPTAMPGNAANQFAGGYTSGIGLGSASGGGNALWFLLSNEGRGPCNAQHTAFGRYRKVIGIPGGL